MKHLVATVAFVAATISGGGALAWGGQGHSLTGGIADTLLNANARQHVQQILGISLAVAAPWPDCVRSVKQAHGAFSYQTDKQEARWCSGFETPAGEAKMIAYAQNNWSQCVDDDPGRACHTKYHFADVPEQDKRYAMGLPGTDDHDAVHAIDAAIAKLEGKPVPAPFKITTDPEALFLITHLVGDLHQPLHVGAVYLDPATGAIVAPPVHPAKATQTQGGNLIMYTTSAQLHGTWDGIPPGWGVDGGPYKAAAAAISITAGDYHGWAATWASDTVVQAGKALGGLTYGPQGPHTLYGRQVKAWTIASKPDDYGTQLRDIQKAQIVKGGKHLADLLNAIWPDAKA
jgi:hypothetical protein